ncbi:HD domain-containing protein [Orenia metallireducens]|uniref:HD domain-containing protein n=1 Tax=Orenia metallireducens TaxID=1413210 RepID=A0A285HXN9_9FIRM|nr:HD-GYP domain-containing protein [Orenia metallireducens]PRX30999.1 HD domain-containing protein [Orenia metallireducens]SNY39471.1 HD domain-containing protein [Orenia metallireducens]
MESSSISKIDLHEFVESLIKGLESKDLYTSGHSERVAHLAEKIATKMKLNTKEIFKIHIAGHLHDIGKIGIRDSVLKKKGRLTDNEYEEIKKHSMIGHDILNKISNFKEIAQIVKYHHERYDGKGYPEGLKGDEIPLESKIIGVVDAFDAMTSPRHYRRPVTILEAIEEINKNSGSQFDPEISQIINRIYHDNYEFLEEIVKSAYKNNNYIELICE